MNGWSFSPLNWAAKWMAIPYGDQTVIIQGILSEMKDGDVVQVFQLSEADSQVQKDTSVVMPQNLCLEIQALLS
jgi:hypothetical protein